MKKENISDAVIRRLPRYYRQLTDLYHRGIVRTSSHSLGQEMNITASQIRQDFSCFGEFGQQGYGYNVEELRSEIGHILGVDNDETICKLSTPNLSSLNQGVEQGGYDVARLIDRLIRNPEAEWEDVMVMPTHIVTRQSTDIYANNDPHIAEVLRYIHENISQKITVNEVVKLVPLSRRLLETRFKKSMGTSIYDYIIQVRIEKMMQLLCEGQSVSEAAAELGFSDIKNVSRTFRQLKGITPSEYREQFAPKRR